MALTSNQDLASTAGNPIRATVLAGSYVVGGPAQVQIDGADSPCTANGLTGYGPAPGDRLLVQRVGSQLEIIQFLSRTIPAGTPLFPASVDAGSYSLGSGFNATISGVGSVAVAGLPTYFPMTADPVIVAQVSGTYELVQAPTMSQVVTTPGGADRVEVGEGGADSIHFYYGGTLVGSIEGFNVGGPNNVLQLTGDPVGPTQAILQLGSLYGDFFSKSGNEFFKFDSVGSYVQGGVVSINTPSWGEITMDSNGIWLNNGHGDVQIKPSGEIDIISPNGYIQIAGGITIEAGTHALTLDGQQVIIGTASATQVSSPGASTTPATSAPAPGGAWSPMAIHLSNGIIGYDSSSIDTKHDVQDLDLTHRASLIDDLDLVTFRGNGLAEDDEWRDLGLVAEQVDQLGWPELVVRDGEGKVAGLRYDRLVVGLVGELRAEKARVTDLETRLAALEAKLSA